MSDLHHRRSAPLSRLPAAAIEAGCVIVLLAGTAAAIASLPYDEMARQISCFRAYAGFGCAAVSQAPAGRQSNQGDDPS